MGTQVIRQPNGLLAVWSTGMDHFTHVNGTPEEVEQVLLDRAIERLKVDIKDSVKRAVATGSSGFAPFDRDWAECLAIVEDRHGAEELQRLRSHIEQAGD